MPVNKDAMARYRIIDRMLADPHKDYTTKDIEKAVSLECPKVTMRMIQKDVKALEEEFGKELVRNAGGRGTVKYKDQTAPLFYHEFAADEKKSVGVTYKKDAGARDIYFAVKPAAVDAVRAQPIHPSQDEVNPEVEKEFVRKYPSLKDCKFFFISRRPNVDMYALFASYRDTVIIVEPKDVRETMRGLLLYTVKNYDELSR